MSATLDCDRFGWLMPSVIKLLVEYLDIQTKETYLHEVQDRVE